MLPVTKINRLGNSKTGTTCAFSTDYEGIVEQKSYVHYYTYDARETESCTENVHRLGKLLANVAPSEAYDLKTITNSPSKH